MRFGAFILGILLLAAPSSALGDKKKCPTELDRVFGPRAVQTARERFDSLIKKRDEGKLTEVLENPVKVAPGTDRPPEVWTIRGVPDYATPISPKGIRFRHYVPDTETRDAILNSGELINAFTSYLEGAPGLWTKHYKDLTGIFLTTPDVEVSSHLMNPENAKYWIDFELAADVPVLKLKNNIYVIPFTRRVRPWMLKYVEDHRNGRPVGDYKKMVEEIAEEGAGAVYAISIKVLQHGRHK